MHAMRWLAAAFMALCLMAPVAAAPTFPPLTGRVVDDAHILSPQTVATLTQELATLEAKTSRQLVVVTLPSLQGYDIADYGYQLGRAWGIGQKKLDNGALLIVAPKEHRVRIEVGYGLEPILTDALSSVIIQQAILPKFRSGDFNGGVMAGVDALTTQLSLNTSQAEARAASAAAQAKAGAHRGRGGFASIFVLLVIGFFVFRVLGRGTGLGFWPLLFLGGMGGGGFGGGGGGGFGGGFGGGGGSFGGGGASGGW